MYERTSRIPACAHFTRVNYLPSILNKLTGKKLPVSIKQLWRRILNRKFLTLLLASVPVPEPAEMKRIIMGMCPTWRSSHLHMRTARTQYYQSTMGGRKYNHEIVRDSSLDVLPFNDRTWGQVATLYQKRSKEPTERNPKLIQQYWKKHGKMVWIPSRTHICLFLPGIGSKKLKHFRTGQVTCGLFIIPDRPNKYK